MNRILIAEDETRIADFIERALQAAGYSTFTVADGASAAALARDDDFDLLVLDLGLPDLDGHDVLAAIRSGGQRLPVIILTARSATADAVRGFDGGADDYVTKPFRLDELLARIRARLRQSNDAETTTVTTTSFVLDLRTRRVTADGVTHDLSAREFALLVVLARHPEQVLSREQLLASVWGYDYEPGSNVVDVYVGHLRRKLGTEAIETVRGMGYRLRA